MNSNDRTATLASHLDRLFGRIAEWCSVHSIIVVLGLIGFTATGAHYAFGVHIDNGFDALFSDDDPIYQYYLDYQVEFSPDETIYLLYHAPGKEHGPFDIDVMRHIARLTEALEREIPFVRKVTSLSNAEFVEATDDLIEIHDLAFGFPDSQAAMLELRDIALSKPMYVNNLISEDGRYGAIVVDMTRNIAMPLQTLRLDPDGGDAIENLYPQVSETALDNILQRPEYAGITFYRSGDVLYNAFYNRVTNSETPIIAFATFALVAIIGGLIFPRGLVGLAAPLTVVLVAIIVTIGFIGALGWSLGFMFTMIPSLVCAIGVSQSVHVMLAYQRAREENPTAADAARVAIESVGTPCLLAALTTAIGLLGMTTSSIEAIAQMAVYAAFGVLACFLLSVTVMVGLSAIGARTRTGLRVVPASPRAASRLIRAGLERIARIVGDRPRAVLIAGVVILGVSMVGVSRLAIDYNFIEELDPDVEVRRDIEKAEAIMGGFVTVAYVFDTNQPDGVKNVDLLHMIDAFTQSAEAHPLVRKAQSIVEITKDLNQALHGDDPAWYRLPKDHDTLAQLLFLYQLSGGEEINDSINFDWSQTVVQMRVHVTDASRIRELLNELDAFLAAHAVPGVAVRTTGMGLLWVSIADYVAQSQLHGYAAVFVLIFLFILVAFRGFAISVYAMVANIVPIIAVLGLMGFVGIKLDYFRLLLATIAIGIAVDDTIHLLYRYRSEFDKIGNYRAALDSTLREVGPALVTTTAILVVAFLTYLYSDVAVLSSFGVLLSAAVLLALIADLFLLPAMVIVFRPFGAERVGRDTG